MEIQSKTIITIRNTINAPVTKVWEYWTKPEHIIKWNKASDDWHCPKAENDLQAGGSFSFSMAAKDGSFAFDFTGVYDAVIMNEYIGYTIADGRKVKIYFTANGNETDVVESFEAEDIHSPELQQGGWQSILNNFKKYTEASQ